MDPRKKQSQILASERLRLQIDAKDSEYDTEASSSNAHAEQTLKPVTVKVKYIPDKHKSKSKVYPSAATKNGSQKVQRPKQGQREFKVNDSSKTLLSFGMSIKKENKSKKRVKNKWKFLGNSKSGGCLDPPYDEDVYEYTIQTIFEDDSNKNIAGVPSENVTLDDKVYPILDKTSNNIVGEQKYPESHLLLLASRNLTTSTNDNGQTSMENKKSPEYGPASKENLNYSFKNDNKTDRNKDLPQPSRKPFDKEITTEDTLKYKQTISLTKKHYAASIDDLVQEVKTESNLQILNTNESDIPNRTSFGQETSNIDEIIPLKSNTTLRKISTNSIQTKPLINVGMVKNKSNTHADNTVHLIPQPVESNKQKPQIISTKSSTQPTIRVSKPSDFDTDNNNHTQQSAVFKNSTHLKTSDLIDENKQEPQIISIKSPTQSTIRVLEPSDSNTQNNNDTQQSALFKNSTDLKTSDFIDQNKQEPQIISTKSSTQPTIRVSKPSDFDTDDNNHTQQSAVFKNSTHLKTSNLIDGNKQEPQIISTKSSTQPTIRVLEPLDSDTQNNNDTVLLKNSTHLKTSDFIDENKQEPQIISIKSPTQPTIRVLEPSDSNTQNNNDTQQSALFKNSTDLKTSNFIDQNKQEPQIISTKSSTQPTIRVSKPSDFDTDNNNHTQQSAVFKNSTHLKTSDLIDGNKQEPQIISTKSSTQPTIRVLEPLDSDTQNNNDTVLLKNSSHLKTSDFIDENKQEPQIISTKSSTQPTKRVLEPSDSSIHISDKKNIQQRDPLRQNASHTSNSPRVEGRHIDRDQGLQNKNKSRHSVSKNNSIDLEPNSKPDISVKNKHQLDSTNAGNINLVPIIVDGTDNLQQHLNIGSFVVNETNQRNKNAVGSESPGETNRFSSQLDGNTDAPNRLANNKVTDLGSCSRNNSSNLSKKKPQSDTFFTIEDNFDTGTLFDRVYATTNDQISEVKGKSDNLSYVDNGQGTIKGIRGQGSTVEIQDNDKISKLPIIVNDQTNIGVCVDPSKNGHELTKINEPPSDVTMNFTLGLKHLEKVIDKLENCIALQKSILNNSSGIHQIETEKKLNNTTSQENIPIWKKSDDVAHGTRHVGEGYLFPINDKTNALVTLIKTQINPIVASATDENVKIAVEKTFSFMQSKRKCNLSLSIPKPPRNEIFESFISKHEKTPHKCGMQTTSKPDQNNKQEIQPSCPCHHKLNNPHTSNLLNTIKCSICSKTEHIYRLANKVPLPTTCQVLKANLGTCKATRVGVTVDMYMDGKKTRYRLVAGGEALQFWNGGNLITLSLSKGENKTCKNNNMIMLLSYKSNVQKKMCSKEVMTHGL